MSRCSQNFSFTLTQSPRYRELFFEETNFLGSTQTEFFTCPRSPLLLSILPLHCTLCNQYQSVTDNIKTDAHTHPYAGVWGSHYNTISFLGGKYLLMKNTKRQYHIFLGGKYLLMVVHWAAWNCRTMVRRAGSMYLSGKFINLTYLIFNQ